MTKYPFNQAAEIAGKLYGSLLGREADKEGFDFIVQQLISGSMSVRQFVTRMLTSDEFREKFIMNNTPNEIAKSLRSFLLKEERATPGNVKITAVQLLEGDWRTVVERLISSAAYNKAFGDENIPTVQYRG